MDSYVLAETFKYLYLMYAEEEDILLPIDEFVFTTEAHLIPLNISRFNITDVTVSQNGEDSKPSETIEDDFDILDEIHVPSTCERLETEKWQFDYYRRLMLRQCGSLRFGLPQTGRVHKVKNSNPVWKRTLSTASLDFTNVMHIKELNEMGISIKNIGNGQIQLLQSPQKVCVCVCVCVRMCVLVCKCVCM